MCKGGPLLNDHPVSCHLLREAEPKLAVNEERSAWGAKTKKLQPSSVKKKSGFSEMRHNSLVGVGGFLGFGGYCKRGFERYCTRKKRKKNSANLLPPGLEPAPCRVSAVSANACATPAASLRLCKLSHKAVSLPAPGKL